MCPCGQFAVPGPATRPPALLTPAPGTYITPKPPATHPRAKGTPGVCTRPKIQRRHRPPEGSTVTAHRHRLKWKRQQNFKRRKWILPDKSLTKMKHRSMLFWCWATVEDGGQTLKHHGWMPYISCKTVTSLFQHRFSLGQRSTSVKQGSSYSLQASFLSVELEAPIPHSASSSIICNLNKCQHHVLEFMFTPTWL